MRTSAWRLALLFCALLFCALQFTAALPASARAVTEIAWWHAMSGFYDRNPGSAIAIKQMTLKPPTENSSGLRLGSSF